MALSEAQGLSLTALVGRCPGGEACQQPPERPSYSVLGLKQKNMSLRLSQDLRRGRMCLCL